MHAGIAAYMQKISLRYLLQGKLECIMSLLKAINVSDTAVISVIKMTTT